MIYMGVKELYIYIYIYIYINKLKFDFSKGFLNFNTKIIL